MSSCSLARPPQAAGTVLIRTHDTALQQQISACMSPEANCNSHNRQAAQPWASILNLCWTVQQPAEYHHDAQDPEEDEGTALNVDWRAYSQTHSLSDKQAKLAEKVRKRENRIAALQREVDKIRVRTLPPCMLLQRSRGLHKSRLQPMSHAYGQRQPHVVSRATAHACCTLPWVCHSRPSSVLASWCLRACAVKHKANAAPITRQECGAYGTYDRPPHWLGFHETEALYHACRPSRRQWRR